MALPIFVSATRSDTTGWWLEFADTSSLSQPISCISNVNRCMVIFVAAGAGRQATAVSVGGQAFTRVGYYAYSGSFFVDVYARLNAPTGNQTLSITLSGRTHGFVTVLQFREVSGWTAAVGGSGSGTSISHTITGMGLDHMIVSCANKYNGIDNTGSGQTDMLYQWRYGCYGKSSYKNLAAGGNTSMSYSTATGDKWAHCVFGLKPMPTGGSGQVIWWFKKWLEQKKKERLLLPFPAGI